MRHKEQTKINEINTERRRRNSVINQRITKDTQRKIKNETQRRREKRDTERRRNNETNKPLIE